MTADLPPSIEPSAPRPRRRRRVLLGVGIAVVVLGAAYGVAAFYLGDRVPGDTRVAGVEIGGLTVERAESALEAALADVQAQPVTITADGALAQISPADVGLALDAEATVAQFTGLTFSPRVLVGHVLGLGDQPAVSEVDSEALADAIAAAAVELDVPPVEGAVVFEGVEASVVEPTDGFAVVVGDTARLVLETWLDGEAIQAVTDVVEPTVGSDAVEAALEEIVAPLTSAPLTVQVGEIVTEVPVDRLVAAARIEADGDSLVLRIDGEALRSAVYELNPGIGEEPRDATVRLEGGRPTVVPAVVGAGIEPEALAEAAAAAALSTDQRTAVLDLVEIQPEFTTEQAEALGIVEEIGVFSTPLTADSVRTRNLVVGTAAINGTLVLPGETFSLIEALGPITPARGFTTSGVVVDGVASQAIGGGLSQLATTTFNAAYFAGMDDVFHKPHSRWFSRYPEGREATMFTPSIDLKWRNNTDYGVLVQAWVADNRTYVRLWGTDVWDVDSVTGPRYNFTAPGTVYNTSPTCIAESGGSSGFTVQVTRTRSRDGAFFDRQTWTTTYQPWNTVVCGSAP